MSLSVPWNHDPALLAALEPALPWISSLFLPFHPSLAGSARPWRGPEPAAYEREVAGLAEWAHRHGKSLVFAANVPGARINPAAMAEQLHRLAAGGLGLRLTLADAWAAAQMRRCLDPRVVIGASTLANIALPGQARPWIEEVGCRHITVAREINRRPREIQAIRDLGVSIGVVLCDECVPWCPFLSFHHCPEPGGQEGGCSPGSLAALRRRPWLLCLKELLPGHLRQLEGLVEEAKIPGRDYPTHRIVRLVRLYLRGQSLEHPSGYYEEPPELAERLASCDRLCERCGDCARLVRVKRRPKYIEPSLIRAARRRENAGTSTRSPRGTPRTRRG
jgi:ferredoxin